MAGAREYLLSGMLCSNRDGFDAVFAGFCAVFRRGERGCANRDGFYTNRYVLAGCANGRF